MSDRRDDKQGRMDPGPPPLTGTAPGGAVPAGPAAEIGEPGKYFEGTVPWYVVKVEPAAADAVSAHAKTVSNPMPTARANVDEPREPTKA